jgi:predicted nucleic acid-binding protein
MVIVDTSIWADHFRKAEPKLVELNRQHNVLMHPYVIGELAAGNLHPWQRTVAALRLLPAVHSIAEDGFYVFVAQHQLMGTGLSFVDIHLLASAQEAHCQIWSRDKRLNLVAERLGCFYV